MLLFIKNTLIFSCYLSSLTLFYILYNKKIAFKTNPLYPNFIKIKLHNQTQAGTINFGR